MEQVQAQQMKPSNPFSFHINVFHVFVKLIVKAVISVS